MHEHVNIFVYIVKKKYEVANVVGGYRVEY